MRNRIDFVDKVAERTSSEHADLCAPPVKIDLLVDKLGITLVEKDLEAGIDGASMVDGNQKIIVIRGDLAENRRRFTIAHELGHLLLHADHPLNVSKSEVVFYRNDDSSRGTLWREVEANRFAANILMPSDLVHRFILELREPNLTAGGLQQLADLFKVSTEAMAFRLGNLGYTA